MDQRATAVRTRYPQVRRRPENVLVVTLFEAVFFIAPFVLMVVGYWFSIGIAAIGLAAAAAIMLTITYQMVGMATKISTWPFGLIALPCMAAYDLVMLHRSMWQYEFSEVDWKGRDICVPAMHVIPRLPKID